MSQRNASNAPFVLAEIAAALSDLSAGGEARRIYLSHLPLSEADVQCLADVLGTGSVTIQHHGLARTIWRETSFAGVWRGEYYDERGKVALTTIEIAQAPQLVLPQMTDIARSAERMERAAMEQELCTKLP